MSPLFPTLYAHDSRDRSVLGDLEYVGPGRLAHGEWHTVANIGKASADGRDVEIQECRMPARFFRLLVAADQDSRGKPRAGFSITTGSGDDVGKLLVSVARELAQGMLAVHPGGEDDGGA